MQFWDPACEHSEPNSCPGLPPTTSLEKFPSPQAEQEASFTLTENQKGPVA